jgi:hypothetical protein
MGLCPVGQRNAWRGKVSAAKKAEAAASWTAGVGKMSSSPLEPPQQSKAKRAVGAPRQHDRLAILAAFEKYIDCTEIPILKEFCWKQKIVSDILYDNDEFAETIRRCAEKKEAGLERAGLAGGINTTLAIFSLKQLGWKDQQAVTISGDNQLLELLAAARVRVGD